MDDGTKIKTMKDDLEEIENGPSKPSKISSDQQRVSSEKSPVSAMADNKTGISTDQAKSKLAENIPTFEDFFSEPAKKKEVKKESVEELSAKFLIEEKKKEEQTKPILPTIKEVLNQDVLQSVKAEEKPKQNIVAKTITEQLPVRPKEIPRQEEQIKPIAETVKETPKQDIAKSIKTEEILKQDIAIGAKNKELPAKPIEEKKKEEPIKPISDTVEETPKQDVTRSEKAEEKPNAEMNELKALMEKIAKRNKKNEDVKIKDASSVQPNVAESEVDESKEFAKKMAERNKKIDDLEPIEKEDLQLSALKPIVKPTIKPIEQDRKIFVKPIVSKPIIAGPEKAVESEQVSQKAKDEINEEDIAILGKIQERLYGIKQDYLKTNDSKVEPIKKEISQPVQKERFEAIKRRLQGTKEPALSTIPAESIEEEKKPQQPIRKIEKDMAMPKLEKKLEQPIRKIEREVAMPKPEEKLYRTIQKTEEETIKPKAENIVTQPKTRNVGGFSQGTKSVEQEEKHHPSVELYERPLAKTLNKLEKVENADKLEDLKDIVERIAKISNKEEQLLEKIEERLQGLGDASSKTHSETKKEVSMPIRSERSSVMDRFHKIEQALVKPSVGIKKEEPAVQIQDGRTKAEQDDYIKKRTIESKDFFKKLKEEKNKEIGGASIAEEKFTGKLQTIPDINIEKTSGIIKKNEYNRNELPIKKSGYITINNYTPPEHRLIHGKQELYSSMKKKIGERSGKENLKELGKMAETKENEILSDREEKERLKKRIIQKYHIGSAPSLLIKKIVSTVVAFVLIISVALVGYSLWSSWSKKGGGNGGGIIDLSPTGKEINEFSSVNNFVEIKASNLKEINALDREIQNKLDSDRDMSYLRLILKKDNGKILGFEDALKVMGFETSKFPDTFMGLTENEYSFIAFRTPENTKRLGFAVKIKDAGKMNNLMSRWEEDKDSMKAALSKLFMSDQTSDTARPSFNTGNYRTIISIRYLQVPNRYSSINYFIYNNMLVFATSEDNIYRMAKILLKE